jgi:hypothetical protein
MTKEKDQAVPARLFVLLAREAPRAVVFRRGPTRWTQVIEWRTDTDTFVEGQWFRGRIYERRCDLSPSGRFLIYFVSKLTPKTVADSEYTYAWTAISRPPFLTALALWPKGDCWHGGGLFRTETEVWLNHAISKPHPNHRPKGLRIVSNPKAYGEDYPVWSQRMVSSGWTNIQEGRYLPPSDGYDYTTEQEEIWERTQPNGATKLRSVLEAIDFKRPGGWVESFSLMVGSQDFRIPGADWADWDQGGRLVFTRSGQVWSGRWIGKSLECKLLADLNDHRPSKVVSPSWARSWDADPE